MLAFNTRTTLSEVSGSLTMKWNWAHFPNSSLRDSISNPSAVSSTWTLKSSSEVMYPTTSSGLIVVSSVRLPPPTYGRVTGNLPPCSSIASWTFSSMFVYTFLVFGFCEPFGNRLGILIVVIYHHPPMNTSPLPSATVPPKDTPSPTRAAGLPLMNTVPLPPTMTSG